MPFAYILGLSYMVLEIFLVYSAVQEFGLALFLAEVVISALVGGVVLLRSPFKNLNDLVYDRLEPLAWAEGFFLRSVGAVLLLLPGVLCDVFGTLLLLVALVRQKDLPPEEMPKKPKKQKEPEEIIDVEVLDKEK
ncbi:FxsA family protein [Helicobacter mehlei]|uniref:FxsA family protein n=1 Tax=Helicobacter mehlei TaxID=2316080 RepID=A0A553V298_9HELI|nr:FxsA family protein [Helicobacter mehlei]TSA86619.1 FxsA family protein [Helicobacter mehlei]